jgi:hypothetical protein
MKKVCDKRSSLSVQKQNKNVYRQTLELFKAKIKAKKFCNERSSLSKKKQSKKFYKTRPRIIKLKGAALHLEQCLKLQITLNRSILIILFTTVIYDCF